MSRALRALVALRAHPARVIIRPIRNGKFAMSVDALCAGLKSAALRSVARHWDEARDSRQMPGWSDIHPSRIAGQLPCIWSYTYDHTSDTFTGRLAGDRIEAIFGKSFRQTPLSEIFPPAQYGDIFQRAKRVISEPALNRAEGLVFKQLDRYGYGERIILPLAADGVHSDGLLGCTEYHSFDGLHDPSVMQIEEWFPLRPSTERFPL